ncbi:ABC transporter ATP-binding protein [Halarchaeum nitratireducens]|uniref:Molybdate/tungstate import ATP-binding protein WtpC n=1 Tax=Halarchaeum nitratireducens TaxID=489913 RepID=A0A830GCT0_9EURY|nr:ABC transporter ATP-binding protein [Halarchaeum nitratireducens]GGN21114.1 spermidine/putrescine import ATP-binding protein PotA [Halarchaeum nitratireducens]
MSTETIRVESLSKRFSRERVLDGIDLTVDEGEFCVVVGPSGCGKSTLLKCIAGLEEFEDGDVYLRTRPAAELPVEERDIGFVFQEFEETLFPHKTVAENVAFGLEQQATDYDDAEVEGRIDDMLELLSIEETRDSRPSELSGGQQQRVEVARQFVRECDIMLLDDPLADLDYKLQKRMELEIRRLHERLGSTFIYVTHNQEQALTLADTLVVMNRGVIEQVGSPADVYSNPETAFVGRFVGDSNPFVATVESTGDDELDVDTDVGTMRATAVGDAGVGDESLVLVRPEAITIDDERRDNTYTGTIVGTTYTGEETETSVAIDGLDRTVQVVQADRADVGEEGDDVLVGWDADDARFFDRLSEDEEETIEELLEV